MTYPHDDPFFPTDEKPATGPIREGEAQAPAWPNTGRRNKPIRVFSLPGIGLRDTKDFMSLAIEAWQDGDKVNLRVVRKGYKKNAAPGEKKFTTSNYIKPHDLFPLAFLAQEAARWLSQYWLAQKSNPLATQDDLFQQFDTPPPDLQETVQASNLPGLTHPTGGHDKTPQTYQATPSEQDEIPF